MTDVFGDIVTPGDVEDAIVTLLKFWMATYLRKLERHTGRAPARQLPDVKTWVNRQTDDALVENVSDTPAVFVECSHTEFDGTSSKYRGLIPGTVAIITRSERSMAHSRGLADAYLMATALILGQKKIPNIGVAIDTGDVGILTAVTKRYIARSELGITLDVPAMFLRDGGPVAPAPDPDDPPPNYPQAETVDIHTVADPDDEDADGVHIINP